VESGSDPLAATRSSAYWAREGWWQR
jgi:hypothetical protein